MRSSVLILAAIVARGRSPAPSSADPAARELRHPGCFLLHDMTTGRAQAWESQSCDLRTSPASTFKIPHVLIGLETGVIPSVGAVRPWDAEKHGSAPWGHEDQTLTSAIRDSVVWYFVEVATEVDKERMRAWLKKLDYGDQQVGEDPTPFWLDGSLTISAREQLAFMRRFWSQGLPVSRSHASAVQRILTQPITGLTRRVSDPERLGPAWTTEASLAYKTGATAHGQGNVTWLVGRVQHGHEDVNFVSRVIGQGPPGSTSPAGRGEAAGLAQGPGSMVGGMGHGRESTEATVASAELDRGSHHESPEPAAAVGRRDVELGDLVGVFCSAEEAKADERAVDSQAEGEAILLAPVRIDVLRAGHGGRGIRLVPRELLAVGQHEPTQALLLRKRDDADGDLGLWSLGHL